MGLIATVLQWLTATSGGDKSRECIIDPGSGANSTATLATSPGIDAQGLPTDYAIAIECGSRRVVVGTVDPQSPQLAGPGELVIYSRTAPGVVAAKIHLRADGSIILNGVEITPTGAIKAPLEVSAMNAAIPVKLSTHVHPTAMGPSGPPTAGT